ncbi:uncharacterized protein EV154DRAFT_562775 [Mucor mucedo]|uniref:uncharacterized protein n=1 Tax=Mucor mucedo TaxID=29922 RepID=UPI0022211F94|nr:uncharacterized protein EV154DRAFT_562775 [Mucor mucedo]KAI7891926.1 hypothetical protein EV154DRAFT_562775 [Mucor mucedo]
MNNQNNNNSPINHQFIEVTPNRVAYEEQEVPVVVPVAAAVSPAAATIKFPIPDTRAQDGIQLAPLLLLNCMLIKTSGWSPIVR